MNRLLSYLIQILIVTVFCCHCAPSLYDQGKSFLRSRQYEEAIDKFRSELILRPEEAKLWRDLGIAYFKSGKRDSALSFLKRANQLNNRDGSAIFYLGAVYEDRADYAQAIQYYRQYRNVGRLSKIRSRIESRLESLTRKKIAAEIDSALARESDIDANSISDSTIAVLYFKNLGQNQRLDRLQKGLAEIISYDLSKVKALRVLERIRLEELLKELQRTDVDAATAPRVGKLLGAKTLVLGSFIDLDSRGGIRIDAGLVDIATGSSDYSTSKEVVGKTDEIFRLEKSLVFNVLDQMDITLTDAERKSIERVPTESLFAFMSFSRGLELEDQGRFDEARTNFEQALSVDPAFQMARDKLEVVSQLRNVEEISRLEIQVLDDILAGDQGRKDRLASSSALVNAGIVAGQDERDAVQEATSTEGFIGVPINVEIVIPPNLQKKE